MYKKLLYVFLILYVITGLFLITDYGLSWDEGAERLTGTVSVNYLLHLFYPSASVSFTEIYSVPKLHDYFNKQYGSWFQILSIGLEYVFSFKDVYHCYLLRHFLVFISYVTGICFMIRSVNLIFKSDKVAFYTTLLYVTMPVFFAEAFYNCKDILLLAVFHVALFYNIRFILSDSRRLAVVLPAAFLIGLLIATRIVGLILFAEICIMIILNYTFSETAGKVKEGLKTLILYSIASWAFTILLWPSLWENPIANFVDAWKVMGKFPWDHLVLFHGQLLTPTQFPPTYLLEWFVITTPLLILLLLLTGLYAFVRDMVTAGTIMRMYSSFRAHIIFTGIFIAPMFIVIIMKAVVYDGWRHLYFIFGGGVLVMAYALSMLFKSTAFTGKWKLVLYGCLIAQILLNVYHIVLLHPYQNIYLNSLAAKPENSNYEIDYWGLSNREAFEYILSHDTRDSIRINYYGHDNSCAYIDPKFNSRRFIKSESLDVDYYLYLNRGFAEKITDVRPWHIIRRDGKDLLTIYKLK